MIFSFTMALIYFTLYLAFLSTITAEHVENYYTEYLANHYYEYEYRSKTQNNDSASTDRQSKSEVDNNYYYLYTRNNPDSPDLLIFNDTNSINLSHFDPSLTTVVIVHGWGGDVTSEINPAVRDAFLIKSPVNIIVVDWGHMAKEIYATAVKNVPAVGRNLGRFLAYLSTTTGVSFSQMHLIGFSLGAHVVGNAGRQVNSRIARITGLDPAGPLWTLNSDHLKSTDAVYVEVVHTNRGILGININVGNADFYPNGGAKQPGCSNPSCHHGRSWQLLIASLESDHFIGRKCHNNIEVDFNNCKGEPYHFGTDDLQKYGTGMYAFSTTSTYPYN